MVLDLHSDAKANFDAKAVALVSAVAASTGPLGFKGDAPIGDVFVDATIGPKDIREWGQSTETDSDGIEVGRYADTSRGVVGIVGEAHRAFLLLVAQMQRTSSLRDRVSEGVLRDEVFRWLSSRHAGEGGASMTESVLARIRAELKECKVVIPLYRLRTERDFPLGNVLIRTLHRAEFDRWRERGLRAAPDHADRINSTVDRVARKYLGYASAEYVVTAEPQRAFERARDEAEDAVAMLRFVSHAAVSLVHRSYCVAQGRQHEERDEYIVIRDDDWYPTVSLVDTKTPGWQITGAALDLLMAQGGLAQAHALLRESRRSEYQVRLLDSLLLYSRSTLQGDVTSRLTYMLPALESFLLRNDTEPVADNLSIRMAFIIGATVDARQSIVNTVRATYSARSRFVHHGEEVEDSTYVAAFVPYAWRTLRKLLEWHERYQTRDELIALLERRKLA